MKLFIAVSGETKEDILKALHQAADDPDILRHDNMLSSQDPQMDFQWDTTTGEASLSDLLDVGLDTRAPTATTPVRIRPHIPISEEREPYATLRYGNIVVELGYTVMQYIRLDLRSSAWSHTASICAAAFKEIMHEMNYALYGNRDNCHRDGDHPYVSAIDRNPLHAYANPGYVVYPQAIPGDRNYVGDYAKYENKCVICGNTFTGGKYRTVCALCVKPVKA